MLKGLLEVVQINLVHFLAVRNTGSLQILHNLSLSLTSLFELLWVAHKHWRVLLLLGIVLIHWQQDVRTHSCIALLIALHELSMLLLNLLVNHSFLVHRLSHCFVTF